MRHGYGWTRRAIRTAAASLAAAGLISAGLAAASAADAATPVASPQPYSCGPAGNAIAGTYGDAAVLGWQSNADAVVACLGGSFYVRDGEDTTYGFGVYDASRTTWTRSAGYLPSLVTSFVRGGADISITNFGDEVTVGGNRYVAIYSRVRVHNPTARAVTIDPDATPGLVTLAAAPDRVRPGATVDHDYVVAADRFGGTYAWPSDAALAGAGSWDAHFAAMRSYWNGQLAGIARITALPDPTLALAYKAGFIDTQIIRDGNELVTGANGYDAEFSHDVIGILANLLTQGYLADAPALLEEADDVVGTQDQYADGLWTYAWPWAIYLEKTGNKAFVASHFATPGPLGASDEPSIEATAHQIAADRTGPGGIMEETNDIDADGYWTIDNYEALMGFTAYRYIASMLGDTAEARWATGQYNSLLADVNRTLRRTIARNHLDYLPCSMVEPNVDNRCTNAEDANWAAPFLFGRWAWDGYLFGARRSGPGYNLIDATYRYGFGRLAGKLPPNTYGGYSPDFWSTAYNAGYGSWGLASQDHRDQGILGYEFMIADDQSGPFSWWESSSTPNPGSPWVGVHPSSGNGSAPHAWGIANANMVLLDSLVAQRSDGSLLVGRGVPDAWVRNGQVIAVAHFPTTAGRRVGIRIVTHGLAVTLTLTGRPSGPVLFQLPAFVDDIAGTSAGRVAEASGTVTVPASTRSVTVELRRPA